MQIFSNGVKITFHLEKGVYVFPPISATGKTYLAKLVRYSCTAGARVFSYSYTDYYIGLPIAKAFDSEKYDVVILDRYDMYVGEGLAEMKDFSRNGLVLVDCKSEYLDSCSEICLIALKKDSIDVY